MTLNRQNEPTLENRLARAMEKIAQLEARLELRDCMSMWEGHEQAAAEIIRLRREIGRI